MRRGRSQVHDIGRDVVVVHDEFVDVLRSRRHHLLRSSHLVHVLSGIVGRSSPRYHWLDGERLATRALLLLRLVRIVPSIDKIRVRISARIIHADARVGARLAAFEVPLHSLVLLQRSSLYESITTHCTNIRLLAGMPSYVKCQVVGLSECAFAV